MVFEGFHLLARIIVILYFSFFSISDAYCDISQAYLMLQIIHLGRLVALNSATHQREIDLKREELNDGCMKAQAAIKKIARKKRGVMSFVTISTQNRNNRL